METEEIKTLHLLIVDEDENMRALLSKIGSDQGYRVTEASSVERAMEILGSEECHLIISDIVFEKMDGIAILKHVKQTAPHVEVVIAAVSDSIESAISAIKAGAYDYIMKPVEDARLVVKVLDRASEKVRLVMDNRALAEMLKSSSEKLESTARMLKETELRDGLTGLYNHRHFQELMNKETARAERYGEIFSLLLFDLDRFGAFNEAKGHAAGDEVIREMAALFSEKLRKSDIIARYGGQEFVLFLPETAKEGALKLAEKYRALIAEHSFRADRPLTPGEITASIGVATFPEDGDSKEKIMEEIVQRVQEAKRQGRNRSCATGNGSGMQEGA